MNHTHRAALLALMLPLTTLCSGCATIAGTAVSPITGGVDLCVVSHCRWYAAPFVFLGGAVAGPFVAFYNGVRYDPRVFRNFGAYWHDFDDVFEPFQLVQK